MTAGLAWDQTGWQPVAGLRAAAGVALPLIVGAAVGNPTDGIVAAAGALPAGVAGYTGIRGRWTLVVATTIGMTVSTLVGSLTAGHPLSRIVAITAWGFAAGLSVTLGRSAALIGTQAVIGLAVFGRFPSTVPEAFGHAGLVAAGGLVQAVLVGIRPPVRFANERRLISYALAQLGVQASARAEPQAESSAGAALADAGSVLDRRIDTADVEVLRGILDSASRVRLELSALSSVASVPGVAGLSSAASVRLKQLALAVSGGDLTTPASDEVAVAAAELSAAGDPASGVAGVPARYAAARGRALLGQLRALDRQVARLTGLRRIPLPVVVSAPAPTFIRLGNRVAGVARRFWLSALDVHSSAFRHAVRLALTLLATELLAAVVPWQRGYWMTLTAVVVLKPDYAGTVQRGVARVAGTIVGALAAGLVVDVGHPPQAVTIVSIAILAWVGYAGFAASYALYSLVVSALVVLLLTPTGTGSFTTAIDRGLSTAVGGVLAIIAAVSWPAWERTTLPGAVDGLMTALAAYADLVLAAYRDPAIATAAGFAAAADAVRRARATAQASRDRAAAEPARVQADISTFSGVLAAASRIVIAIHALRATLEDTDEHVPIPEAEPARVQIVAALLALGHAGDITGLIGLRDRQQALAELAGDEQRAGPASGLRARRIGLLATHLDPLVDAIDTAAHLLGMDGAPALT